MDKLKTAIRAVAFLLVFAVLFITVQDLVTPDHNWPKTRNRLGNQVRGIYAEDPDSVQVLWLGTSHMKHGLSPMVVYRETGIRSYNLATAAQPVVLSKLLFKQALKANPSLRLVVLDVGAWLHTPDKNLKDKYWRAAIDSLNWKRIPEKLELSLALSRLNGNDEEIIEAGVLPILRYHSNYRLSSNAYNNPNDEEILFTKGYSFQAKNKAAPTQTLEELEVLNHEKYLSQLEEEPYASEGGEMRYALNWNFDEMEQLATLCRENGCELVLTKIPTHTKPSYGGYWGRDKHDLIAEAAEKLGLTFLDLQYEPIDLDWSVDTSDSGRHLNTGGATKVSAYLARWLAENYDLGTADDDPAKVRWDYQLDLYNYEEQLFMLRLDKSYESFLERLQQMDTTLFVAVSGTSGERWSQENQALLTALTGAHVNLADRGEKDRSKAYLLIGRGDRLILEGEEKSVCATQGALADGTTYSMTSNGGSGKGASIVVNGSTYKANGDGLLVVVYDNALHCVVDCVTMNSNTKSQKMVHGLGDKNVIVELRAMDVYEKEVLKGLPR